MITNEERLSWDEKPYHVETRNAVLLAILITRTYNHAVIFDIDQPRLLIKFSDGQYAYRFVAFPPDTFKIEVLNNNREKYWFYINTKNIKSFSQVYASAPSEIIEKEIKKLIYLMLC